MSLIDMFVQSVVSGLLIGCIFTLTAVGLTLIWGLMRLINFAHGEFMMLSMYICFWLWELFQVDPLITTPINMFLFFILGLTVYKFIIKRLLQSPVVIQIFSTFGMKAFLIYLAYLLWTPDARLIRDPYLKGVNNFFGVIIGTPELVSAVISVIAIGVLAFIVKYTKTGKAIRATTQDSKAALSLGVDIQRVYALAWAIGLMLAALAGSLLTNFYYVTPDVGSVFMFAAFAAVTLGGAGSIFGSLIGGIVIGEIQVILGSFTIPALKFVYVFIAFVLLLLFKPEGLFGE